MLVKGLVKMVIGLLLMGGLLFVSAGTTDFPGAWRMLALFAVSMLVLGGILLIKSPELMEKRLNTKETEPEQKKVILFSALIFTAVFVLCGLDFRFGWTHVPRWIVAAGCLIFLASYAGFGELLRENEFLSRTVEVQEGQQVVSTGMYGIVRHPMYSVIMFLFLSMPLIIGSFAGLVPFLALPAVLVKRIRNEEKVLEEGLPGYREYEEKVRYRMVPFLW